MPPPRRSAVPWARRSPDLAIHLSRRRLRRLGARLTGALKRLLFALLPLLALLGLVEAGFRLFWEPPPRPPELELAMIPHHTRIWALSPGEVTAAGMRHHIGADTLREVPLTGAPHRILTLGDSSIFGHGVEDPDTLHARLSTALTERGAPTDVLCGGVPGYSTEQSLVLLDEEGWRLEPDLLLIGNLWSDNNYDRFVDREWLEELRRPSRRVDFLLLRSRAWWWLRGARHPEISSEGGLPVGWIRDPRPQEQSRRRVPLEDYAANLDRMLVLAEQRGVGALMLAPCNRERLGGVVSEAAWDVYFEGMHQVAERRGVGVVDACEALREAGVELQDAFLDEMHPTGAGNAAYAAALASELRRRGWPEQGLVPDGAPVLLGQRQP